MKTMIKKVFNFKMVTWSWDKGGSDEIIATDIVLWNRIILSKGRWDGYCFHTGGVGSHQSKDRMVTFYFLKFLVSFCFSENAIRDNYAAVDVEKEASFFGGEPLFLPQRC